VYRRVGGGHRFLYRSLWWRYSNISAEEEATEAQGRGTPPPTTHLLLAANMSYVFIIDFK